MTKVVENAAEFITRKESLAFDYMLYYLSQIIYSRYYPDFFLNIFFLESI
jgi:hypothetical protein